MNTEADRSEKISVRTISTTKREKVQICNGRDSESIDTYVITDELRTSVICLNKTDLRQTQTDANTTVVSCYTASKE